MNLRDFAAFDCQSAWTKDERAYRAGEQAGHLGAENVCPDSPTGSESYWRNGYAYGEQMRGHLLPDNQARFPLGHSISTHKGPE